MLNTFYPKQNRNAKCVVLVHKPRISDVFDRLSNSILRARDKAMSDHRLYVISVKSPRAKAFRCK